MNEPGLPLSIDRITDRESLARRHSMLYPMDETLIRLVIEIKLLLSLPPFPLEHFRRL